MGADAAQSPGARRVALTLTFGLHLLAAWSWLQQRRPMPRPADASRMVTILLQLADPPRAPAPASARTLAPRPRPRPAPAPEGADKRSPSVQLPDLPTLSNPAPAVMPASPSPSTTTSNAAPAPAPDDSTAAAAPSADGGFAASLGRRQAGRIDRELRGGKSGVPAQADTPWARFQRGLEDAHVESSMSAHLDSYTSPDGVVIYRRRVGSRTSCYQTGSVGLGVAGTRTGGNAGNVACPDGVTWTHEE